MTLNTQSLTSLTSLTEVRVSVEGSTSVSFPPPAEAGRWVGWRPRLRPFHDNALKRAGKGVLQVFMRKGVTGYSRAPLTRHPMVRRHVGRHRPELDIRGRLLQLRRISLSDWCCFCVFLGSAYPGSGSVCKNQDPVSSNMV